MLPRAPLSKLASDTSVIMREPKSTEPEASGQSDRPLLEREGKKRETRFGNLNRQAHFCTRRTYESAQCWQSGARWRYGVRRYFVLCKPCSRAKRHDGRGSLILILTNKVRCEQRCSPMSHLHIVAEIRIMSAASSRAFIGVVEKYRVRYN